MNAPSWKSTVLGAAVLILALTWPPIQSEAAIVITVDRNLFFGTCENVTGSYTVTATDTQTSPGCGGPTSARFSVTGGTANKAAAITLIPATVSLTNGTNTISVPLTFASTNGGKYDATGKITIWVGGTVVIPSGIVSLANWSVATAPKIKVL